MTLDWPANAAEGVLSMHVARIDIPVLGWRATEVDWRCPLRRLPAGGWGCAGNVQSAGSAPGTLAIQLDPQVTRVALGQGQSRIQVTRLASHPEALQVLLTRVPAAWLQGALAQAWPQGRLTGGHLDGRLQVRSVPQGVRVHADLHLAGVGLEAADASVVTQGLTAQWQVDYRQQRAMTAFAIQGELRDAEFLAGNTYVTLAGQPVGLEMEARQQAGAGWQVPRLVWRDGAALEAVATLALTPEGQLDRLALQAHSVNLGALKPRYLSGWLGLAGLSGIALSGGGDLDAELRAGRLQAGTLRLQAVEAQDPAGRFAFEHLQGELRYSSAATVTSALHWQAGQLYGLRFGAAQAVMVSREGRLEMPVMTVPLMGGTATVRDLRILPPQDDRRLDIRFGLQLRDVDVGQMAQAFGLPPFQGQLSGDIPLAHYANDRVDFDGGLQLGVFGGRVEVSSLVLERPFGTAPSMEADIAMDGLDLLRLTEVLGFGSISGRLDGRITGLRLVDWTPVTFDARFVTDPAPGVPQRISQRAVQDIGSVGDVTFVSSLQGRLIGMFSEFGYRRIGIGCRLERQICTMSGLRSDGNAFTIVEGRGVPRLEMVGHNRAVDWETLVERLRAASRGDVAPVIQ